MKILLENLLGDETENRTSGESIFWTVYETRGHEEADAIIAEIRELWPTSPLPPISKSDYGYEVFVDLPVGAVRDAISAPMAARIAEEIWSALEGKNLDQEPLLYYRDPGFRYRSGEFYRLSEELGGGYEVTLFDGRRFSAHDLSEVVHFAAERLA